MQELKDILLTKIETGTLRQKPRWQFILLAVCSIVGITLLLVTALYIVSFIALITREQGFLSLIGFGGKGLFIFLHEAPWALLILLITITVILYIIIKHYSFGYKKPAIYMLAAIACIIAFISFSISQFDRHMQFAKFGDTPRVPLLRDAHDHFRRVPNHEITHGRIMGQIDDQIFAILTDHDETYNVQLSPNTHFGPDIDLDPGSLIIVFGPINGASIQAFGIIPEHDDKDE